MCNGEFDCADKSDETHCGKFLNLSDIVKNLKYIPKLYVLSVIRKQTSCNPLSHFDCGGGECIPLAKVCDRHKDCSGGEDEQANMCNINECATNNGDCMHKCIDQPIGYKCECESG